MFFATPPTMTTLSFIPTLFASAATLPATEIWIPAIISSLLTPADKCEITSDSANTVHVLLILTGDFDVIEISPNIETSVSNTPAITSKNLPVPAAHLSFMTKLDKFPFLSNKSAFISCPPISITVPTSGTRKFTPLA